MAYSASAASNGIHEINGSNDCTEDHGTQEEIIYVACPRYNSDKPDYFATVDVNPKSATYCQVIHRLEFLHPGDEVHHFGWNTCCSCPSRKRTHFLVPCMHSSRVYVVDATSNPRAPKIDKVCEPYDMFAYDVSFPHTPHCMPDGDVLIGTLGDAKGNAKGSFIVIDGELFNVKSKWTEQSDVQFNYDFWYQPRHNVMISTEWGVPNVLKNGFDPKHVLKGDYGHSLHVWRWRERDLKQTIELDKLDGSMPFEMRFLHNPESTHAFVGCALGSSIYHVYWNETEWVADKAVHIPAKTVKGWTLPEMPALVADILISLDDRFLYCSCYLHGDVRQYDITDPFHPQLTGQVFVGGSISKGSSVTVKKDSELPGPPEPCIIRDRRIDGGPNMLQLSRDGKRLYVTNSLYSVWDNQFYPDLTKNGSCMLQLDVDIEKGGMQLNRDFLVDFGKEPDGPALAHEMRYPGGDCTSDIKI